MIFIKQKLPQKYIRVITVDPSSVNKDNDTLNMTVMAMHATRVIA